MKQIIKNSINKSTYKKGFTLIELIVVIAIIAALMLILVPTMNGFVNTAKKQANQANAKAVYTAIIASETAKKAGLTGVGAEKASVCAISGTDAPITGIYTNFWSGKDVASCTAVYNNGYWTITVNPDNNNDTKGEYSGS